jgi:hypothetical protein
VTKKNRKENKKLVQLLNIFKRLPNFQTNKIGGQKKNIKNIKKHKNKKGMLLISKSFSTNIKIFIY